VATVALGGCSHGILIGIFEVFPYTVGFGSNYGLGFNFLQFSI